MTDGGCLSNTPAAQGRLRDDSPILDHALTVAVDAYDAERQRNGREPLSASRKAAMRPSVAAAVEAYLGAIGTSTSLGTGGGA